MKRNPVPAIQLQDPAGYIVQEVPVVGHRDDGAFVLPEVLLQPLDRFGVEMVGRLIQQQNIRFLDQQAAQRDAALFPAREDLHPRVGRGTAQGVHRDLELVLQLPAVDRLDLFLKAALLLEQPFHLVR